MMNASLAETAGIIGKDETSDCVEINRQDALAAGIVDGDRIQLRSDTAAIEVRAKLSDEIRAGTLVIAHGWGTPLYDAASLTEVFRRGNERNKLVSDTDLDPLSSVPRLNGTLVSIVRLVPVAVVEAESELAVS